MDHLNDSFEELTKNLPRFKDGRTDFTDAPVCPVLNAVVYYKGKILIVKRSPKVGTYPGLWNGISGYIDEPKSIEKLVLQELEEEISITKDSIYKLLVHKPHSIIDEVLGREWIIHPILVVLNKKPSIVLDWEHTDYAWIYPEKISSYKYVDKFDISLSKALSMLQS